MPSGKNGLRTKKRKMPGPKKKAQTRNRWENADEGSGDGTDGASTEGQKKKSRKRRLLGRTKERTSQCGGKQQLQKRGEKTEQTTYGKPHRQSKESIFRRKKGLGKRTSENEI